MNVLVLNDRRTNTLSGSSRTGRPFDGCDSEAISEQRRCYTICD